MNINSAAQYANIVSALTALAAFIPTVISYYRNWNASVRRILSVLFFLSLGIAIGSSFAPRVWSPAVPSAKTASDTGTREDESQAKLRVAEAAAQAERVARETAEKRIEKESASRIEAERQAKDERTARETAQKRAEKENAARIEVEREAKDERMVRVAAERKAASELAEAARNRGAAEARVASLSTLLQGERARASDLEQQLRDARAKIKESFPSPPPPRDGFIRAYFYDEPRGWTRIEWSALQRMRHQHHDGP
jgi:hypothetical protein